MCFSRPDLNLDNGSNQIKEEITTNGCAIKSTGDAQKCDQNPSNEEEVRVIDPQSVCRPVSVTLVRCDDIDAEVPATTPLRRYPKRNRCPPPMYKYEQSAAKIVRPRKTKPSESDYFDTWSNCIIAYRYDLEKNFFPEPGPSTINYYVGVDLPGYYTPIKSRKRTYSRSRKTNETSAGGSSSESEIARTPTPKLKKRGRKPKTATKRLLDSPERQWNANENTPLNFKSTSETNMDDECDDIMAKSFYVDSPSFLNNTFADSPLPKSTASPLPLSLPQTQSSEIEDSLLAPVISNFMTCISKVALASPTPPAETFDANALTRIKSTDSAPSRMEVTNALNANEYPQVVNVRPFYSNPKDILQSHRTEVGHTVLQLGGAAINDCEPFVSQLNIVGLNSWRKLTMSNVIFPINGKKLSAHQQSIELTRELLASDKKITIVPHEPPPSLGETNKWILMRNRMVQKNSVPSITAVNGNGYHVTESETIVIDDDSEPEIISNNINGGSEKTISNDSSPPLLNGCHQKPVTEYEEDVICLDDSDDDAKIGSHYKISFISSPSTGTISLKDEIKKITKEVGAVSTERNFS